MATHSSVLAWRIPGKGGAWWAAVYGVAQSRTRLKRLSSRSRLSYNVWRNRCNTCIFNLQYSQPVIILLACNFLISREIPIYRYCLVHCQGLQAMIFQYSHPPLSVILLSSFTVYKYYMENIRNNLQVLNCMPQQYDGISCCPCSILM